MKLRTIALAGAAVFALSSPALAQEPGWYLGLGVGYDNSTPVHLTLETTPQTTESQGFQDTAIYLGDVGYRFDDGMRIELELGYDNKDVKPVVGQATSGGGSLSTAMMNIDYDIHLTGPLSLTVGGGLGAVDANAYAYNGPFKVLQGAHTEFEWQGIAGLNYALADDIDIFADYRYRVAGLGRDFNCPACLGNHPPFATVKVAQEQENVGLLGVRWYLGEAPPPPPPPAPPPPPPPPPPPVKTFIVFFDFDKSNLTAEAQSVVSEAVKTAKANGFVKVEITGHTDTVGSDNYNQALSERRAEAVKDEMVRQGMDGGSIAIEGKSFHDPLVATGPGVREPQNRRAVIDLGG